MTEKIMYEKFLKKMSPFIDFIRIETGATRSGVPDIYFVSNFDSSHGWLELKIAKKTSFSIAIPYRPGQQLFLSKHKSKHITVFALIYYKNHIYLTDDFSNNFSSETDLINKSIWVGKVEANIGSEIINFIRHFTKKY